MNLSAQSHAPVQTGASASMHPRQQVARLFLNKQILMRIFVLTILLTINGILMAGNSSGQELDKIFISWI